MRYHELDDESKRKYGPELLDIIEARRSAKAGADKIEDYVLVDGPDGEMLWIYCPDID